MCLFEHRFAEPLGVDRASRSVAPVERKRW